MSVRILQGDCLEILPTLDADSIDSVVTDPPYHLTSIVKRFGADNAAPAQFGKDGAFARASKGFMGKQWDGGDVAFRPETWAAVYRVLKPGAHLLAFGGTRGHHRMFCAIEDAGFEIRDCVLWLYGSGFPKSHNAGGGWGTALKPAWEPVCLARKPLIGTVAETILKHGTGALNIDGGRVATDGEVITAGLSDPANRVGVVGSDLGISRASKDKFQAAQAASLERANALGRWPANVIHDGSDEVLAAFPESDHARGNKTVKWHVGKQATVQNAPIGGLESGFSGDEGSTARFFYTAKADADDRWGSRHPTVKPVDLIAYLCRLVTPPNGICLDPFAGTGTTGEACMREGFNAVLIEREAEYVADIKERIAYCEGKAKHSVSSRGRHADKGKAAGIDTPLFKRGTP